MNSTAEGIIVGVGLFVLAYAASLAYFIHLAAQAPQ